jgi:hypothetical protein
LIGFPDSFGVFISETFNIARKTPLAPRISEKDVSSKDFANINTKTRNILLLSMARPLYFLSLDNPKVLK